MIMLLVVLGVFCFELMGVIRPVFAKHFNDEQMQEFDDDLAFQKAIWLDDLSKNDFNFVIKTIENIKMADKWHSEKQTLIKHLKDDPRYTA